MKYKINVEKLTGDVISIDLGVNKVVISSILLKTNTALTRLIRFSLKIIFQEHTYGKMGYINRI